MDFEDKKMNKIFITGATGFIGANLTHSLIEEGINVGMLKRRESNMFKLKNIASGLKVFDGDLKDIDDVNRAVSLFNPDVIIHLAAYYSVEHKKEDILQMIDTNVLGTINLLQAANKAKAKLFINTSSCFVYKAAEEALKEDCRLEPVNLYALTKIQAEQACSFYSEHYKIPCITLRLFPPYGYWDNQRRLIPYLIRNFLDKTSPQLTSGKQKWDFIHVDDIVDAYKKILKISYIPLGHEIFNIGTGHTVSVENVSLQLRKIMKSKIALQWSSLPHRENENRFICADIQKAKNILKWEPKINILEEGLEHTVKWFTES